MTFHLLEEISLGKTTMKVASDDLSTDKINIKEEEDKKSVVFVTFWFVCLFSAHRGCQSIRDDFVCLFIEV